MYTIGIIILIIMFVLVIARNVIEQKCDANCTCKNETKSCKCDRH